jgi:hypothetical protein
MALFYKSRIRKLSVVLLASPKPSINPSRSQTAGDALSPFPFDVLEPCYSPSSCSVVKITGRHANQRCQCVTAGGRAEAIC